MAPDASGSAPSHRPLRIWIPLLLVVAIPIAKEVPSWVEDGPATVWMVAAFGPVLCSLGILLWWLLASRATGRERLLGGVGLLLALAVVVALSDATARGVVTMSVTAPMGFAAFALAAAFVRRRPALRRTWIALVVGTLGFACTLLLRNEGLTGEFEFGLRWRWAPTSDELLLAEEREAGEGAAAPAPDGPTPADLEDPVWPGFRGAARDGRTSGAGLGADWEASRPELLWKVRMGPGWSSFAVAGPFLFTMEQRGPVEATVCLRADTGERVWRREIEARFDDPLGGPGPRATPTLADGALYTLGARGNLARLDPATGSVVWEVELTEVAETEPPIWGFASSPLVLGDLVVVFAGGEGDLGTLAFRAESGELVWSAPAGPESYSSAHLMRIADRDCVVMLTNLGMDVLAADTGEVLLAYSWGHNGYRVLQPQRVGETDVLVPTGLGSGTRRVRLSTEDGRLAAQEVWTSRFLKPDFSDLVTHGDHAYGFDTARFTCIDLETGERAWKEGRYGSGQVLLLQDQERPLVIAESGELVLLAADPTEHRELARFQALEGKSWNHPVVAGNRLYLRNSQEAACYRLPPAP
jgi:outer membrane protein assembly factor BamB